MADDGAGVPAEDLARLTERFFRGTTSTADPRISPSGTGLGLGLAIVDALVKANGGRLSVAGTPGDGLTVRVTLPRAHGPTEEVAGPPAGTTEPAPWIERS